MVLDVWVGKNKQGSMDVSKQEAKRIALELYKEFKQAVDICTRLGDPVVFVDIKGKVFTW